MSVALEKTYVLHRTPWKPQIATKANGMYIELKDGTRLLDACGGAAVTSVGHSHPVVVKAIKEQYDQISFIYSMQLSNEPNEALAKKLIETSDGAFALAAFVCGGTEAMEGLLKTARQYFYDVGQPKRSNFIGRQLSFHGNSIATLSLAYHPTRRLPYAAILDDVHFHHVSPAYAARFQKPDETVEQYVERLRKELEEKFIELDPDTVAGFVCETVVGATTGVVPPPKGYLEAMKSVCDKYGALFMLDEVMSGMGRMGSLHAWQAYGPNAKPDIQAVAKGLGGGYVSIGAVLLSEKVANGIKSLWKHGHTYQAQPAACAGALAVQNVIHDENLLDNICIQGEYLRSLLEQRLRGPNSLAKPYVFDIRGRGGFWGIEFDFEEKPKTLVFEEVSFAIAVQQHALKNGLIIMGLAGGANLEGTKGDHLIIAPSYNITRNDVEKVVDMLVVSVEHVLKQGGL